MKFVTVISVPMCSAQSTSSPRVRARRNGFLAFGVLFLLMAAPWLEAQASSHPPARHKVERVVPSEQEIEGDTVEWRLEFTFDVTISSSDAFYLKRVEFEPPAGNRRWDSGIVTYSKHNNSNKVYDVKFTNFGGREGVLAFGIDCQYITGNGQNCSYSWAYRTTDVRDIVHNAHYIVDKHPPATHDYGNSGGNGNVVASGHIYVSRRRHWVCTGRYQYRQWKVFPISARRATGCTQRI